MRVHWVLDMWSPPDIPAAGFDQQPGSVFFVLFFYLKKNLNLMNKHSNQKDNNMLIIKEPGSGGKPLGSLPCYVKNIIKSDIIKNTNPNRTVRISKRTFENEDSLFIEDNTTMLRVVLTNAGELTTLIFFKLLKPNKLITSRPMWVELTSKRKTYLKTDTEQIAICLAEHFTRKSDYPLSNDNKIRISPVISYMDDLTNKKDKDPIYFCGKIVNVLNEQLDSWLLSVECLDGDRVVMINYTLKKKSFYGKHPNCNDWIVMKQNHLTSVLSDRDLDKFFTYTA